MDRENYSLMVTIMRIIAGVFGLIAFALMFTEQANGAKFDEIAFGTGALSGACPAGFIGYILAAIGGVASIALIFVKNVLGNAKTVKLVDFAVGGILVIAAVLVVLTKVWYFVCCGIQNNAVWNAITLAGGPIVACVFAGLAAGLNIFNGFVEERI